MGFKLRPTFEEFICPPEVSPPADDSAPLRVTIRTNLPLGELDAITAKAQAAETYLEVFQVYAPYVVQWNVVDQNEAGELVPVPPPAEGDMEAIEKMLVNESAWIIRMIQESNRRYPGADVVPLMPMPAAC